MILLSTIAFILTICWGGVAVFVASRLGVDPVSPLPPQYQWIDRIGEAMTAFTIVSIIFAIIVNIMKLIGF